MTTAVMTGPAAAAALAPLREEIAIFPGPAALDGSPTWTLHDPARNRFYRLGWREFEMLSRWDAGSADELAARVDSETTLRIGREDVDELARFLAGYDLLRLSSPQATASLIDKAARQRESWGRWLLHNYLFMRIPLARPDRFLTATYPLVAWVYSRTFVAALLVTALLGMYLIAREWDTFLATFVDMFTLRGLLLFSVTLACLKVVHELGHAYTAKRFGCRVPSMGLALLVLVPVLYTDVNDAWKLTARRQRLAIGIAGVSAELGCAAIAACVWGFLPNGPARSVAFLVATSTWIATVLLNLSPFMRFDGYYVLSDWLETPNLHGRAFALARWWLRAVLFGLDDPPPEDLPVGRRRLLVLFAFLTWAYRFLLFIAIAVIVYHFTFKAAGVTMAAVEVGYFLAWPIVSEAHIWWSRRADIHFGFRSVLTLMVAATLIGLLLVPWRASIEAPALLKSRQRVDVFVPEFGARVESIRVAETDLVHKGALLLRLSSPDLDYRLARVKSDIDVLEWQLGAKGVDAGLLERSQITAREYETARAEQRSLLDQKTLLTITAPVGGRVVDMTAGIVAGVWLPPKLRLMSIIDPTKVEVDAYIDEADLERVARGNSATFIAEADPRIELRLRVTEIARASTRVLTDKALASVFGGPITVRATKQSELVPDKTIYRVTLQPSATNAAPERILRGAVVLRGERVSLAARAWRAILAVAIRESGA